ncbi:MAG TPA: hypothetical protein VHQ66_11480 [Myxococcota bacterium]|nr:hypothetical protein [Myxococcota bacterium]
MSNARAAVASTTCLATLLSLAAAGAAAEPVRLSDRVAFAEGSGVTRAVREECGLERGLPEYVRSAARDVELVSGAASGPRTLDLHVTEVHAPGGGPFSGPKAMTVEATLREGGRVVATARSRRVTAEPFGGTCDQLRKVARAIASDLAAWLASPSKGATLGDAP